MIEVDLQLRKTGQEEPVIPPLQLSLTEPPMCSTIVDESPDGALDKRILSGTLAKNKQMDTDC